MTLLLVLMMALTWAASEDGMGDTTSMAIISPRVISMEADFTAVAGTGRREEEITNGKSEIAN